ncbi:MAG: UDP-3-O-acyl-N-acetylglucosamine deacetylase [Campylobacterota bacterium]
MLQRTIKKAVSIVGIGLHKAEPVSLQIEPAAVNSGIKFYRSDIDLEIDLSPGSVIDTKMATVIGSSEGFISTIEHFLSAVYAYGIDNLYVTVSANEMPVMDGSAASFCMMIDEAGLQEQDEAKKVMQITKEVTVEQDGKFATLSPHKKAAFSFEINFEHPVIGNQTFDFDFSTQGFKEEISRARTFGFMKDVQYLRSKNLALGGSLQNAIVLDEEKVLNSEGLRYKDEFVRHKILDAMGDLMLLGHNILGKYSSKAGSHHLNHLLTKELIAQEAFELVELKSKKYKELSKVFA